MFWDRLALPAKITLLFFGCVVFYGEGLEHYDQPWITATGQINMTIEVSEDPRCVAPNSPITMACYAWKTTENESTALIQNVSWYRGEGRLTNCSILGEAVYFKRHAELSDTGNYTCVAHVEGRHFSKTIEVTVEAHTVLAAPQRIIRVKNHDSVTLSCEVRGNLPTNFTWEIMTPNTTYESVKVPSNKPDVGQGFVNMTLHLTNVTRNMEGFYDCMAKACQGWLSDFIRVTVVDVPTVTESRVVAVGASRVCLKWIVYENDDPVKSCSVKQMANDTPQSQYNEAAFTQTASSFDYQTVIVNNLVKATPYKFEVMCTNSVGQSKAEYSEWVTTLAADPDFIPDLAIEGVNYDVIGVRIPPPPVWLQNYTDYYRITVAYDGGEKIEEEYDWKSMGSLYNITDLTAATVYRLQVAACNSCTEKCGEPSKEEEVSTVEQGAKFVPNVTVNETTCDSITIGWSMPPAHLQNLVVEYKAHAVYRDHSIDSNSLDRTNNSYVFRNLISNATYTVKIATYIYRCGYEWSTEKNATTREIPAQSGTILWSSLLATAVLLVIVLGVWLGLVKHRERASRREFIEATLARFNRGDLHSLDPELNIADQAELLPYNTKWEFPKESLKLDKILGKGEFGVVRKAEARSICRPGRFTVVAVKLVSATARLHCLTALSRELKILANLGKHLNIVNLLGACTKNIPWGELLVIMEFCRFGNLRDYLLSHRADFVDQLTTCADRFAGASSSSSTDYVSMNGSGVRRASCDDDSLTEDCRLCQDITDTKVEVDDSASTTDYIQPNPPSKYQGDYANVNLEPLHTQDLLCWAWQITQGMKYLGSRKILHGDLAARNILLANHNVVKICDFGMARSLYMDDNYQKQGNEPVPVKWMAIESLRDRIFSVQSDIWAFGIVLWELFTLAEDPYPGVKSECLCQKLVDGFRMTQPKYAAANVYQMMLNCWDAEPSKRPSFKELANTIAELLDEKVKKYYIDLNSLVDESNAEDAKDGVRDYLMMSPAELKESITIESTIESEL